MGRKANGKGGEESKAHLRSKLCCWDIMPGGGAILEVTVLVTDSNHGSRVASYSLSLINCPPTSGATWSARCLVHHKDQPLRFGRAQSFQNRILTQPCNYILGKEIVNQLGSLS